MNIRIEKIEEYGKLVAIAGFRESRISDVTAFIEAVRKRLGPHDFQVLNADHVAGWRHLCFAALNALKAFDQKRNFAGRLDMEMLLYASCQDQITKAFTLVGITPQTSRVAFLMLAESEEEAVKGLESVEPFLGVLDDSVLEINEEKFGELKQVFSVSDLELEAITATSDRYEALTLAVIERCALLGVHR